MFRRALVAVAACCLVLAARPVTAQVDRGGIVGAITDPAGARVAAAQVTITNLDTNQEVKVVTDNEGNYAVQLLKIGNYSVSAEKPGFQKTLEHAGVVIAYRASVCRFSSLTRTGLRRIHSAKLSGLRTCGRLLRNKVTRFQKCGT